MFTLFPISTNQAAPPVRGGAKTLRHNPIWRCGVLLALLLAGAALWPAAIQAQAPAWDPIRRIGQSARGLALGGTGMSYADDEMALFYNPAGLGAIDEWYIEVLPLALEASERGKKYFNQAVAEGGLNFSTTADVTDFILDNLGLDIHIRGFLYPVLILPFGDGFTIGATKYYDVEIDMNFIGTGLGDVYAEGYYRYDEGSVVGMSFPLLDGKILFGVAGRNILRDIGEDTITNAELTAAVVAGTFDIETELGVVSGQGTAWDAGFIYRWDWFSGARVQWAGAVSNIGNTPLGDAGTLPAEYSFGLSMRPNFSPLVNTLIALEYRDTGNALTTEASQEKRFHAGLELGFFPLDISTSIFTLRGGYGQGGISYGAELALWHVAIQYTYFEQDYGTSGAPDLRKREILQFNIGF